MVAWQVLRHDELSNRNWSKSTIQHFIMVAEDAKLRVQGYYISWDAWSGRYLQKSSPKLIYPTWVRLVHNWVCLFPYLIGVFCHTGVFHLHMVQNQKQRFLSLTIFFSTLQFHCGFLKDFKTNGTLKGGHHRGQKKTPYGSWGVLTRQKCAETPHTTFWHPSLNHMVPQKPISSLFNFSKFSPSHIPSCVGLRSFYFVPEVTSSYFLIFPQRCAPENYRTPSFQKLIWCHMVSVGEKSDVNFWP